MSTLENLLIHIHTGPGVACAACGDTDNGLRAFVIDVGYWNTLNDKCAPKMLKQDYTDSQRADQDTSALLGERVPDPKKVTGDQR